MTFMVKCQDNDTVEISAIVAGDIIATLLMSEAEATTVAMALIKETDDSVHNSFFLWHHADPSHSPVATVIDVYNNVYAECPNDDIADDVVTALCLAAHLGYIGKAVGGPEPEKPQAALFRELDIGTVFKFEGERFFKCGESKALAELKNGSGWQLDPFDFNLDAIIDQQ